MEADIWITFISGILIGISPCIILMLSIFGSSLIMTEGKSKYLKISIGLLSGMVLTYILISFIFVYFFSLLDAFYLFKYIFAGVLISIGIWQILESRKEKSLIFQTPEKVKTILKDFIENNSGFYAFLIGIIFVLVKIPCFGGVYLAIIYELRTDPLLFLFIMVYLIAMILPAIIIITLFRLGLEFSKINDFRLKYRTHLRIISGLLLIFLSIYLLIF